MFSRRISKKAGLSPGALFYVGEKKDDPVAITTIDYGIEHYHRETVTDLKDRATYADEKTVSWVNISGVHDVKTIRRLGEIFNLHPLVLEDILNVETGPKIEEFDDYLFIVLKMLSFDDLRQTINHGQISLIAGKGYVVSLHEASQDIFDPLRMRIEKGRGRIRTLGSDYLAHALMDTVVDHYFKVLEDLGEAVEDLEGTLIESPLPDTLEVIKNLKREILFIRRSIWPLREAINSLIRGDSHLIGEKVIPFFRDLYDHVIYVIDTVEIFRDMLSGILDIYLSSLSNKMNEVMKVLTIIATIFIPMTFIAGIYGMNFEFMPELKWKFAYPVLWLVMLAVFIGMIIYFKRRKWL
jgi:magnesium transporter